MMLAALPKSALARTGPLTEGAESTFRGSTPLYLPELAHPTEQQPWGASAVGWARQIAAALPACSPPPCSGRSIEQLQNRTQHCTTQLQVSKQSRGKQRHPTAEQSLPWIITSFFFKVTNKKPYSSTAHSTSQLYLSFKETRLCLYKVEELPC